MANQWTRPTWMDALCREAEGAFQLLKRQRPSLLRRTRKVNAVSAVELLRLIVARVTRMSEGCQIELRLIVLAITEKDANTELRCRTQNQAGRQEVVAYLQLEGKTELSLFNVTAVSVCQSRSQMTAGYRNHAKTIPLRNNW